MQFDRRDFLKFVGTISAGSLLASCSSQNGEYLWGYKDSENLPKIVNKKLLALADFKPTSPSSKDELVLPEGYSYNVIRSWGDSLGSGPQGEEIKFGFNNDFIAFFPLTKDGRIIDTKDANSVKTDHGLLWINHEMIDPFYVQGQAEQAKNVGGSIIRIYRDHDDVWQYAGDMDGALVKFNRRLDANTPMNVTGPVAELYSQMTGTLANCSGARTPWMTALTCEENFHFFDEFFGWQNFDRKQYGWIVEIDPYDRNSTPRKHTALGRFAHENACLAISNSGRLVVYMGDDTEDEHIYKFISRKKFNPNDRKANMDILSEGDLYVARMDYRPNVTRQVHLEGQGTWEHLSIKNKKLQRRFDSQAELLIETRKAAKYLHATPLDRPEDLELSPVDGSIYVSLTKSGTRNNPYGSIMKVMEDNGDYESMSFSYDTFVVGGDTTSISCPDNLAFDNLGNLWVTTDISGLALNQEPYRFHANNALFVIPSQGPRAGVPQRFASAPVGAELTGPWFSPDYQTLFLSVQHPGEDGTPSKWPHESGVNYPRSSVVAISRS